VVDPELVKRLAALRGPCAADPGNSTTCTYPLHKLASRFPAIPVRSAEGDVGITARAMNVHGAGLDCVQFTPKLTQSDLRYSSGMAGVVASMATAQRETKKNTALSWILIDSIGSSVNFSSMEHGASTRASYLPQTKSAPWPPSYVAAYSTDQGPGITRGLPYVLCVLLGERKSVPVYLGASVLRRATGFSLGGEAFVHTPSDTAAVALGLEPLRPEVNVLRQAVWSGNVELARLLLKNGVSLQAIERLPDWYHVDMYVEPQPQSALAFALLNSWPTGQLGMLLDAGGDPNGRAGAGMTPLLALINKVDADEVTAEAVSRLLKAGADPNRASEGGTAPPITPLTLALARKKPITARTLTDGGAH
jgi:hypothetical protein